MKAQTAYTLNVILSVQLLIVGEVFSDQCTGDASCISFPFNMECNTYDFDKKT